MAQIYEWSLNLGASFGKSYENDDYQYLRLLVALIKYYILLQYNIHKDKGSDNATTNVTLSDPLYINYCTG
jgi:hypothetical protein